MDTILELKNVKKYFNTPKGLLHAVDGISFKLERGNILGVVGESGCGKSTLGRVILRLLDATDGNIVFEDEDITNIKKAELKELRKDMQMIFQDPYSSINSRMTVSEIIGEPLIIYKIFKDKIEYTKKVSELMDTVGLASRLANVYPHELDGGRRQRIGVARALALSPKFIVCDEPVSALDVSIQAQILNLMQDLQQEKKLTYIFITHNLSVVKHISDDICVMYLGNLVEKCNCKGLFTYPYHPYTKALLAAIPIPKIRERREKMLLKGEIASPINPKLNCSFSPRCSYAKEICEHKQPELIEVAEEHFVACHFAKEINGIKS